MQKSFDFYRKMVILGGDIVLIILSVWLAVAIRIAPVNVITYNPWSTLFIVFCYILSFYIFGLYNLKSRITHTVFLTQYLVALCTGTFLVALVFYGSLHWQYGRGIVLINLLFIAVLTFLWRYLFKHFGMRQQPGRRVLIVGAGASGRSMYSSLKTKDDYEVIGFVDDAPHNKGKTIGECSVIGDSSIIPGLVADSKVDEIMVAITHEKRKGLISALLEAKLRGVRVRDMQAAYENITQKLPVEHLSEGWLAYSEMSGVEGGIYKVKLKSIISFFGAFLLMLVTSPIFLVVAVVIKLESKGPVLFRQKRVGLNGEIFEVVKFRSMREDAELCGAVWASENDPRVTKVGRVIRKLRIDELPQLWNVLKGEMSLVGPRPERPEFVRELQKTIPFYFMRQLVKPGITGWGQVNFKYGASREDALEKLQYDLYYVKNLSLFLDIRIILKTIEVVIFGKGSR